MVRRNRKSAATLALLLGAAFVLGITGCSQFFDSLKGEDGSQGAEGPSVYFVNSADVRYYSGGTVYIGWACDAFGGTATASLSIVNNSAAAITVTGISTYSGSFTTYAGTFTGYTPSELSLDSSSVPSGTTIPAGGSSAPFTVTLQYDTRDGVARERIKIAMEDSDAESYDSMLDFYGDVTYSS